MKISQLLKISSSGPNLILNADNFSVPEVIKILNSDLEKKIVLKNLNKFQLSELMNIANVGKKRITFDLS